MKITIDKGIKHTDIEAIHNIEKQLDIAMAELGMARNVSSFTDYFCTFEYELYPNISKLKNEK